MDLGSFPGRWLVAAAVVLALGGCGGGVAFGFGFGYCDDCDDDPPAVSIASTMTTVEAGDEVKLVAAASDESGIDDVTFYRRDGDTEVVLGSDGSAPYEWTLTPADAGTLVMFARARDDEGNRTDSTDLTITVTEPSEAARAQAAAK
jgi:hypothetical protein